MICEEDTYLRELVRYIHLNPLRARLVSDLSELDRYRYSGHSLLMGKRECEWQDSGSVLGNLGSSVRERGEEALSGVCCGGVASGAA